MIKVYDIEKYSGIFVDLCDPRSVKLIDIPNCRLDASLIKRKTSCNKNCYLCNYCLNYYKNIIDD